MDNNAFDTLSTRSRSSHCDICSFSTFQYCAWICK